MRTSLADSRWALEVSRSRDRRPPLPGEGLERWFHHTRSEGSEGQVIGQSIAAASARPGSASIAAVKS